MVRGVVMGKDSGEWIDSEVEKCASCRKRGGKSRQNMDMGCGEKGAMASKDHTMTTITTPIDQRPLSTTGGTA